ncbi:unnamed protein product [Brugia timori]|uniref:NR LBD domain-containing protein n=1 Tax=Brugia timori TaxID=42155 RepID=A0A0R3QRW7_9BILA|nr:unnamed protein product [Brugia timori]
MQEAKSQHFRELSRRLLIIKESSFLSLVGNIHGGQVGREPRELLREIQSVFNLAPISY